MCLMFIQTVFPFKRAPLIAQLVKNPPANAGDTGDTGSTPGLGRSPGGGNSNLLQYSCLENSMDRGAWWATVHEVAKSQTQLRDFHLIVICFLLFLYIIIYSI